MNLQPLQGWKAIPLQNGAAAGSCPELADARLWPAQQLHGWRAALFNIGQLLGTSLIQRPAAGTCETVPRVEDGPSSIWCCRWRSPRRGMRQILCKTRADRGGPSQNGDLAGHAPELYGHRFARSFVLARGVQRKQFRFETGLSHVWQAPRGCWSLKGALLGDFWAVL
eukprot:2636101-Pyramimonas_sp.AAC.1